MAAANGNIYSEAGTKAFVNMLASVLKAGENIKIAVKEMGGELHISASISGGSYTPPEWYGPEKKYIKLSYCNPKGVVLCLS